MPAGVAIEATCCFASASRRSKESSAVRAMSELMSLSITTSTAGSAIGARLRAEVECVSFVAMKVLTAAFSCHTCAECSSSGTATLLLPAPVLSWHYQVLAPQSRLISEVLQLRDVVNDDSYDYSNC